MKKLKITLSLVIGVTLITACKKGDEDPFFSLTSRKARISGEWNLASLNSESTTVYDGTDTTVESSTGNSSSFTVHRENNFYTWDETYLINDYSFVINRDGTWSSARDVNYSIVRRSQSETETTTGQAVYTQSGNWTFLHKTKNEYRNKERVVFSVNFKKGDSEGSTTVTDYDDPLIATTTEVSGPSHYLQNGTESFDSFTYDLRMLKSKEMKWINVSDYSLSDSYVETGGGYEYSYVTASTEEMVWVAK